MGDNVNHFFDLCFCVCVVFVHLFEKVTTEKKQKIPTQICVCVVFLCCSAAFFSEQGYPTPLSRFFLGEGVLCVWAAFELCFWASVQQKNTFRCHPVTHFSFLCCCNFCPSPLQLHYNTMVDCDILWFLTFERRKAPLLWTPVS